MIWMQTASGRAFDLLYPTPEMIDFRVDVPEQLARQSRFAGAIRSGAYSIAQHCAVGADCLFRDARDLHLAGAFLLHDAHEAYLTDITTPVQQALSVEIDDDAPERVRVINHPIVSTQISRLKARLDRAIYEAAGFPWPLPAHWREAIKLYDLRMLATERKHLLGPAPQPWHQSIEAAEPLALKGALKVWPWPKAAEEYRQRLIEFLPKGFTL